MKKSHAIFLLVFIVFALNTYAQNNAAKTAQNQAFINHWYEAPESTKGDTVAFKTTKHLLGPNDDPAYAWSEFNIKNNKTFEITYWRWSPSGNYAYSGAWSQAQNGNIVFDFGSGKSKCEIQIISVSPTEMRAIIKEISK